MEKCKFCKKEYKNIRALSQHQIRCKLNPNKIDTSNSWGNKIRTVWNKGLTKETDDRVKKQSESLSKTTLGRKLKPLSEDWKKSISNGMNKFLQNNPDKVPYLLNHSSKISYPEKYFQEVFNKENIPLKYHNSIGKYQPDFSNLDLKIIIEIDGEQHYVDKRIIEHDKVRTKYLENLGYTIYRVRWSTYKSLAFIDKQNIINDIKNLFNK